MTIHPAIRFIAVDAGHLVAENSIRKHLQQKGWSIIRITECCSE